MGGAFAAISDDPSGIFHNPAGIVFSMESYFSLTANAYSFSNEKFKDIVPGKDYTYRSQGLIPTFFGLTQTVGKNKFGLAIVVPNSDLIDQDDSLEGISTESGSASTLRRRFFRQNTTYLVGPAWAREIGKNLTVGVSLFGFFRTDRAIDNQWVLFNPLPTGQYLVANTYLSRQSMGLIPKVGLQYMPLEKWALGLTADVPVNLSGSSKLVVLGSKATAGKPVLNTGNFENDMQSRTAEDNFSDVPDPIHVTLGNAYFFTKKSLISLDVDYYSAALRFNGHSTVAMVNIAVGAEHYLADSIALRGGFYTNNAATPGIENGQTNQSPHVNVYNGTLGLSFYRPGSSLTLSSSYGVGVGKGQAIGDSTAVQKLERSELTFFVSGGYQL